jgi:hypothetical protein
MTSPERRDAPRPGQWPIVIAAWVLVGVPLLWGIGTTLQKAAALFH